MHEMTKQRIRPVWQQGLKTNSKITYYFLSTLSFALLLALPSLLQAAEQKQALLLQPSALHQALQHTPNNLIIIDTRTPQAYLSGHIPTAINLPIDQLYRTVDHIKKRIISPLTFQQLVEKIGLKKSDSVVFYTGYNPLDATRALWTFEFYGHPVNRILDGGFPAWEWETLPVEKKINQRPPSQYTVKINPKRLASKFKTLVATQSTNTLIIDARPQSDFYGFTTRGERSGHIPNAVNLDFSKLFTTSKYPTSSTNISTFIDTEQFKKLLAKLPQKSQIILYCNAGSEASALYFSFRQMNQEVSIYDGSWLEWSADETLPIALNQPPKNFPPQTYQMELLE